MIQLGNGVSHSPVRGLWKWAEGNVLHLSISGEDTNQGKYPGNRSYPLTPCSHWCPRLSLDGLSFFHFTFCTTILWVLNFQNRGPFHDWMSTLCFPFCSFFFLFCLLVSIFFFLIAVSDSLESEMWRINLPLEGSISGKAKRNFISLFHTTFYLILTNTLWCRHYYIYFPGEETEA